MLPRQWGLIIHGYVPVCDVMRMKSLNQPFASSSVSLGQSPQLAMTACLCRARGGYCLEQGLRGLPCCLGPERFSTEQGALLAAALGLTQLTLALVVSLALLAVTLVLYALGAQLRGRSPG